MLLWDSSVRARASLLLNTMKIVYVQCHIICTHGHAFVRRRILYSIEEDYVQYTCTVLVVVILYTLAIKKTTVTAKSQRGRRRLEGGRGEHGPLFKKDA